MSVTTLHDQTEPIALARHRAPLPRGQVVLHVVLILTAAVAVMPGFVVNVSRPLRGSKRLTSMFVRVGALKDLNITSLRLSGVRSWTVADTIGVSCAVWFG